jgi:uroporphyrinogen-III synthase
VLLRQSNKGDKTAERLSLLGAEVIHIPMLDIVPIQESIKKINSAFLSDIEYVIFTSQNAVAVFKEALFSNGLDVRALSKKTIVSIGKKTEEALASIGLVSDWCPETSLSVAIADLFEDTILSEKVLIPCAKKANPALSKRLKEKGYDVSVLTLYDTHIPTHFSGHIHSGDHVFFTSPSTVEHLIQSKVWSEQDIVAHSIGSVTTKALQKSGKNMPIFEAKTASIEAMIENVIRYKHDS